MSRRTGPDEKTRLLVLERDNFHCVVCGTFVGDGYPLHHRKPRGSGGSSDPAINSPANLITICHDDHQWVESARSEAAERGFLVPMGREPSAWAVEHAKHGICYLLADGTVEPILGPDEPESVVA